MLQIVEESRLSEIGRKEWEALLTAAVFRNPFLTPTWMEVWQNSFGGALDSRFFFFTSPEEPPRVVVTKE